MLAPSKPVSKPDYEFSNDWFGMTARDGWDALFAQIPPPARALEIGCYEGRASVYLIEHGVEDLTCIDTWQGGGDLPPEKMAGVEARFGRNTAIALGNAVHSVRFRKRKQSSVVALAELIYTGQRFDFIYLDASHTAPDVLRDATMAFHLLEQGGTMIFDDYLWHLEPYGQQDLSNMPKMAIDAFVNANFRKIVLRSIGGQVVLTRSAL